jgi:hypothetical protein
MWAVALVALAACNQVLGLDDLHDRTAPIDAPFACPPIGTTPVFSPIIHQSFVELCYEYARFSTGLAVGMCKVGLSGAYLASQGMGDGPLTPIPGLDFVYDDPRPTPDGTLMLAVHNAGAAPTVEQFRATGVGWSFDRDIPFPHPDTIALGHVATDPDGGWRMLVVENHQLEEWKTSNDSWVMIAMHPVSALGLADVSYATFTEDGLRALLRGTRPGGLEEIYFTDRPDVGTEFRIADRLDAIPVATPYLDRTCARIYLAAVGSVFYAQQQ